MLVFYTRNYLLLGLCLSVLVSVACGSENKGQRVEKESQQNNEVINNDIEDQDAEEESQEEEQDTDDEESSQLDFEDTVASTACLQRTGTATSIIAATSEDEAAQALIQTTSDTSYMVSLPENGSAYLTIEIADWMASVRFFSDLETSYEVVNGQVGTERSINGACPDKNISDQRWLFHGWGSYTVRIDSSEHNPTWFMAVME